MSTTIRKNAKATTRSKRVTKPTQDNRATKRTRTEDFTAEERISAVTAALTANAEHPLGKRALEAACTSLRTTIHISTLADWLKLYRPMVEPTLITKPIDQVIIEQRDSTLADMNKVRQLAIQELQDKEKAHNASWRDSAVVLGIVHDKIEDSIGLAPDMVAVARRWQALAAAAGWNAAAMWDKYCDGLEAKMQAALILPPAETSPAIESKVSDDNGSAD